MQCTFFFFEGVFRDDHPEHGGCKLFSSALVPCSDASNAYKILVEELDADGIRIVNVEEQYLFNPEEADFQDPDIDNIKFLSLYNEVARFNTTIFTPWHLFYE